MALFVYIMVVITATPVYNGTMTYRELNRTWIIRTDLNNSQYVPIFSK